LLESGYTAKVALGRIRKLAYHRSAAVVILTIGNLSNEEMDRYFGGIVLTVFLGYQVSKL
jgi:hypothetical protein